MILDKECPSSSSSSSSGSGSSSSSGWYLGWITHTTLVVGSMLWLDVKMVVLVLVVVGPTDLNNCCSTFIGEYIIIDSRNVTINPELEMNDKKNQ